MATEREKDAIRKILQASSAPCIVELGARTGEEEQWLREACGDGPGRDPHYIMVEPDMWNLQHLLDNPRGLDQNRKVIAGAVTHEDGIVQFFPSISPDGSRTSGSIRLPTQAHFDRYPDVKFMKELASVVPGWSLDSIFRKDWLTKIDLLWADIQGAEADMILGGTEALKRTRYLFMEVYDEEMYVGQAGRRGLLAILQEWRLVEDFGDNVLLENPSPIEGRI
jgi:FkbM family methyltransferase